MMPPSMIHEVDKMARAKKVSFAEVVRDAVGEFNHRI